MNKLSYLFKPRSIAVVGASGDPAKSGNVLVRSILDGGYRGRLYLINRHTPTILGMKTYSSVRDVPSPVDLAFICVPAKEVPKVVQDLAKAQVKSLVIITAGFRETGDAGWQLEKEIIQSCQNAKIPMVGPNCMGLCCFATGLVAPSSPLPHCEPGSISFISQSGTYGIEVLNFAIKMGVPFNTFLSSGNEAVTNFSDYLEYFGQDESTKVIIGYMESVKDGKKFLKVAKEVSHKKPIVIMKFGRTAGGARAVASHTGALAGSHAVFKGCCRQAGIIEVYRTGDLLHVARALATQPIPMGRKIGIVVIGGGYGVALTDFLIEQGLEVPEFSKGFQKRLRYEANLQSYASTKNPIDLVGDLRPQILVKSVGMVLNNSDIDGLIVMPPSPTIIPQSTTKEIVEALEDQWKESEKPMLLCSVGGTEEMQRFSKVLPIYGVLEEAGEAMAALVKYGQFREDGVVI